jgi:hypothetical protein
MTKLKKKNQTISLSIVTVKCQDLLVCVNKANKASDYIYENIYLYCLTK